MNLTEFIKKTEMELFLYLPKKYQNHQYSFTVSESGQMYIVDEFDETRVPEVYLDLKNVYEEYERTENFGASIKEPLKEYLEKYEIYAASMTDKREQLEELSKYPAEKIIFTMLPCESAMNLDCPYRKYGDLFMVYQLMHGNENGMLKTSLIHFDIMKIWQVTEEVLYQSAMKNTPYIFPVKVTNLEIDTKAALVGNEKNAFGIATLFYKKEQNPLHMLAEEFESNLEILPFSMHEVLVTDGNVSCEKILELLRDIVVRDRICFSETIYHYDRSAARLVTNEYEEAALQAEKTGTTVDPGVKNLLENKEKIRKGT